MSYQLNQIQLNKIEYFSILLSLCKMALEWARNIKQQPDLDEALDINEVNILELLDEIKQLKKEVRKLERDNDVLYFDLQNKRLCF